jgi:hypothetical protein
MKYYKQNNEIYAYELDGSQDHLIGDKVAMTAEEVEAHINPPIVATIPQSVTPKQARLALLGAGLYDSVNLAVKANPAHEIYWEYALEVKRDDALLIELSTALGITSEQLDDLFVVGSEL